MSFWERTRFGWHATFYGLIAVLAVIVLLDDSVSQGEQPVALLVVAAVAVAYTFIGRRALGGERYSLSFAYLAPVWLLLGALSAITPSAFVLLLVLSPQTWAMLPVRGAVMVNALGVGSLVVIQIATGAAGGEAVVFGAVNLAVSLILGLWIGGVVTESEQRASLIEQLERTRTELAASEHERGILAERQRLAHEIHDTLAQGFTSVLTLAQALEIAIGRDDEQVQRCLLMLQDTARDNLAESRALVAALTPPDLAGGSLDDALGRVVQRFAAETGVDAAFALTGQPVALAPDAEVVILRTLQESLANVRKHAKAASVAVGLAYSNDVAALTVVDDGKGFSTDVPTGHGLPGMRARVEQLGGSLLVDSVPGAGTTVTVRVPRLQ